MRRRRNLYAKIFGWFLLTATVGSLVVLAVTAFSGTQPLGSRWMRVTQDLYARSAVDFYESGGKAGLAEYLGRLRQGSGMEARLLDAAGRDLLGDPGGLPVAGAALDEARRTGHSGMRLGRVWTEASPVDRGGRRYYFVARIYPMHGFLDAAFVTSLAGKFALGMLVAGLLCLLLTRHLVLPIRALQDASARLADGELGVRVAPAMGQRNDELMDTARVFDRMADRIETLLVKRQSLLGDISHELRSPLTRLSVSLELLRRGETDVVDQMETELGRMNEMIGQILLLTRLDTEAAPPVLGAVDLGTMLRSIALEAAFEGQAAEKTVVVEGSATVRGDANLLRSGLENIVRNAVRYTEDGTAVSVKVGLTAQGCEVLVEDSGPGVPDEALPFLFDPFYRVSESRDRMEGGTGLGLSIAQKVAQVHGGRVWAENRADRSGLLVGMLLPGV